MLTVIDEVLSATELAQTRELLHGCDWESGTATAGELAAQVKHNRQVCEGDALQALREVVLKALERKALFFTAALPLRISPPQFNRYSGAANTYGAHVDSAVRPSADGYLRADLAATLFLSDPADYDGGVLQIQDQFAKPEIKLKAGSLVLYDASSVHAVSAVTRGERLAAFMFIQSMVRSSAQRQLLFDMDMALLALRESSGDASALVSLNGTYHNLLRMWAEV
jgi:PKHD-type hydroxylase